MTERENQQLTFISVQRYPKVRARNTTPGSALLLDSHSRFLCVSVPILLPLHHTEAMRNREKSTGLGWNMTCGPLLAA